MPDGTGQNDIGHQLDQKIEAGEKGRISGVNFNEI